MTTITNNMLKPPTVTNNSLSDAVRWVNEGYIVVLFNTRGNCRLFSTTDNNLNFDKNQIITILCENLPDLLDDGEWNYYIKSNNNVEENVCRVFFSIPFLITLLLFFFHIFLLLNHKYL